MRWLLWVVVAAGLIWSGVWYAASVALDRAARQAVAAAGAQGLIVAEEGIAVRGFPNRLDLTVTAPRLADPVTGAAWQAPFVQLFALVYRPWHLIAALPAGQRLTLADGTAMVVEAGRLQASVVLEPVSALPLDRAVLAGEGLALVLERPEAAPAALAASRLNLAMRRDPSRAGWHEIGLVVADLAPDAAVMAALPPGAGLPPAIGAIRLRAFAGLTAPLDRFAGETRPRLTALELREASLRWGALTVTAEGAVVADAAGQAEGRIDIRIEPWPLALDAAVAAGLIRAELAPTWAELARRLAETSPDPARLDLPLTFARGRTAIGPLPLGPAPFLAPAAGG
ncbi:MAG TPA: DUF2125 domain-containing protein [Paracoccaceae bacterium]|nr:DUF2125 domain-containing protein [Paracoccaceae bacterium]